MTFTSPRRVTPSGAGPAGGGPSPPSFDLPEPAVPPARRPRTASTSVASALCSRTMWSLPETSPAGTSSSCRRRRTGAQPASVARTRIVAVRSSTRIVGGAGWAVAVGVAAAAPFALPLVGALGARRGVGGDEAEAANTVETTSASPVASACFTPYKKIFSAAGAVRSRVSTISSSRTIRAPVSVSITTSPTVSTLPSPVRSPSRRARISGLAVRPGSQQLGHVAVVGRGAGARAVHRQIEGVGLARGLDDLEELAGVLEGEAHRPQGGVERHVGLGQRHHLGRDDVHLAAAHRRDPR